MRLSLLFLIVYHPYLRIGYNRLLNLEKIDITKCSDLYYSE